MQLQHHVNLLIDRYIIVELLLCRLFLLLYYLLNFWWNWSWTSTKFLSQLLQSQNIKNCIRVYDLLQNLNLIFRPRLPFFLLYLFSLLWRRCATFVWSFLKTVFIRLVLFEHFWVLLTVPPNLLYKLPKHSHPKLVNHQNQVRPAFLDVFWFVDQFIEGKLETLKKLVLAFEH